MAVRQGHELLDLLEARLGESDAVDIAVAWADCEAFEAVGQRSVLHAGARQRGPSRDAREGAVGQRGLDAFGERQDAVIDRGEVDGRTPNGAVGAALAGGQGGGV